MSKEEMDHKKRRLLIGSVLGFAAVLPGIRLAAAGLTLTPRQSRGPFYPVRIPLDSDNDLVTVNGKSRRAKGEVTNVIGRVLDERGRAIDDAHIEIWQCDANGRYHHPGDNRSVSVDPNFQGYGEFTTAADGAYRFRTIKPVPYPGRAPHIHFAITVPGTQPLVTQMYIAGAPENQNDWILNNVSNKRARDSLIVEVQPHPEIVGELMAEFDIVLIADGRYSSG